ncbi:hypothetical protein EV188_101497 [Actinomycetospora succinea]|uniref:Uncharacterized protein n=1 Tax=Actinomycetospora succinea TaxID=663603 RepID=A0A4R6VRN9_9PSEU|nr:hypothetical protein [Actinomycetospora succinea]TDQ65247.1 hypothetical protein EV188_101497 [Actinomycetospora succinea]
MAERSTTSRAIAAGQLPAATAAFIREQGAVRGLFRDPLVEVTHALRTDETTTKRRLFGGTRTSVRTVEMLLTPDLLVVSYRDGARDGEDPAAQVSFHRLYQIEFAPLPSELLERAGGAKVAVPAGLMPLTSTPVGSTQRGSRMVPLGDGPDAARFREALLAATERCRRGAGA